MSPVAELDRVIKNLEIQRKRIKENAEDVRRRRKEAKAVDPTALQRTERRLKSRKRKDEDPLAFVLDIPLSEHVYQNFVRDLVELQTPGAGVNSVIEMTASTLAKAALHREVNPQEALEVVTHLAGLYSNDAVSRDKILKYARDIIEYAPTGAQERQQMVQEAQRRLHQSVMNRNVTATEAQEPLTYVERERQVIETDLATTRDTLVNNRLEGTAKTAPSNKRYLDIDELSSFEAKEVAIDINDALRNNTITMENPVEVEKLRKKALEDKRIPEKDVQRVLEHLTYRQNDAAVAVSGLSREYQDYKRVVGEKDRLANRSLKEVNEGLADEFQRNSETLPPEITAFLSKLQMATNTSIYVYGEHDKLLDQQVRVENPLAPVIAEFAALKAGPYGSYLARYEAQINQAIAAKKEMEGISQRIREMNIDPHLEQVGVSDDKEGSLKRAYERVRRTDTFIELLEEAERTGNYEEFIKTFTTDVKRISDQLLDVSDSDYEVFFDHLFTQFWHEPIHNNLVTGLSKISKRLADIENADHSKIKYIELKDTKGEFNYKTKKYDPKKVRLSEYFNMVRDQIAEDKEFRRYTHNIYVLMLNRSPLETYKNYANSVKTNSIDKLLVENPELERAIRLHMGYLRTQFGLNGWKTPVESIYSTNIQTHQIPIDQYVIERLKESRPDLKESELFRYAALARGYVLGISWEAVDVMASGAPVAEGPEGAGRFTGFFGPLNSINFNRYVLYRWSSSVPSYDYLYTDVNGEGNELGLWNVATQTAKAKEIQEARKTKEPPRIVTDEMAKHMPFIEDTYHMGTGGLEIRWGWRKRMFNHLIQHPTENRLLGKTKEERIEVINRLKTVNLSVANRYIEDWRGGAEPISMQERNKLRKIVLDHMRLIAPQEFLVLDNDLLHHKSLAGIFKKADGSVVARPEERSALINELMLDAGQVTDYLLEKTVGDTVMTLEGLTDDVMRQIFGKPRYKGEGHFETNDEYLARLKRVKLFMTRQMKDVAQTAIDGGSIEIDGKVKHIDAWRNAAYIKSFPTHLSVKRNAQWNQIKENVVGRLAGDNDAIAKAIENYWNKMRDIMQEYRANPDRAKQEKFAAALAEIKAVWNAYDAVHGKMASVEERASSYRVAYQLGMLFDRYFAKSTTARAPLGVGTAVSYWDQFSSFAHLDTGMGDVLQFDEQIHRVLADQMTKMNLIGPLTGHVPTKFKTIKIGPFRQDFAIAWDKVKWNGAQFRRETGSQNWQVAIDIARGAVPLVMLLIIGSALAFATKEDEKN